MLKAVFNDKSEIELKNLIANGLEGKADGKPFNWSISKESDNAWHIIDEKGASFVIELITKRKGSYELKINNSRISVEVKSQFDMMLEKMGISHSSNKKMKDLKAPMPGLVLEISVKEGDDIKEGDQLLVLEAMKMENVIKAGTDAKVKSIKVKPQTTIEKGELMIEFE
jgi:biotin carboxyl carrier protein